MDYKFILIVALSIFSLLFITLFIITKIKNNKFKKKINDIVENKIEEINYIYK